MPHRSVNTQKTGHHMHVLKLVLHSFTSDTSSKEEWEALPTGIISQKINYGGVFVRVEYYFWLDQLWKYYT